ncbi:MAG: hypothetical protein CMF46_04345 [Legionellales bacterium]|nr:hypothetical protein [Legionellales bacterium]|tara:strand:+ start:1308 stop:2087 length:780 start_codon:yes stop_codon:yes gene_type:complete
MIDSHCHLHHINVPNQIDPAGYCYQQAIEAGVNHMLCVSIHLNEFNALKSLSNRCPNISISTGQHPNDTSQWCQNKQALLENQARDNAICAIGETGLDYFHNTTDHHQQKQAFVDHINVAIDTKKPLIIHTRNSFDDTLATLTEMNAHRVGGIFHCFTGSATQAQQALDLGFHISFSGILTFKSAQSIRDSARVVPLDKLLIETDSPYLAPVPYRGQSNQPAWVKYVCEKLAEIHEMSSTEMEAITDRNFDRLFKRSQA